MSLLRPQPCRLPVRSARRAFSAAPSRSASLQIDRNDPEEVADTVPAYPHGPARWYKQSNKGLYGGQRIQFGNNVSGDFNTKTRRTFQVNVLSKRLWSHALDRFVQLRVTARTLRTIDRVGGLDEYLLSDNAARIKQLGVSGWWLRWAIMQQPSVKARFEKERYDLGLGSREEYDTKLKALEKSAVGADLEEAYAALPEEGELADAAEMQHETLADQTVQNMGGLGEMQTSPPSESVLEVTNPPDLPPLKFRVDRRAHVVLTPHGWVRTQPDRTVYTKQWIIDHEFPRYIESKMAKTRQELARLREGELWEVTPEEERQVLSEAKRRFTRELKEKVDALFEERRMKVVEKRAIRARMAELRKEKEARRLAREETGSGRAPDAFDLQAPNTAPASA